MVYLFSEKILPVLSTSINIYRTIMNEVIVEKMPDEYLTFSLTRQRAKKRIETVPEKLEEISNKKKFKVVNRGKN